ncbi:MAG TPA: DUF4384 domain-containing protein [Chromatiaceae bacterium]|jgi:hypothetical protein|nr:MAG: hypothetical protein N838_01965 [Thiohalocapsa sp. PB-PSB1]HBG94192.1 DUF4384 domain-containing protein [Chromatiaceae bacterium]HCS91149.1 DUF4384 domain-containing protein [Chromatiaceae bacterium]
MIHRLVVRLLFGSLVVVLSACAQTRPPNPMPVPASILLEPGRPRGIIECRTDQPCGVSATAADDSLDAPLSTRDVTIEFLHVDADGRRRPLAQGSALATGEAFAVRISAHRDAHVYLWHQDPLNRITELVSASGALGSTHCRWSNLLRAGQIVELPAPGAHYTLDAVAGTERIQPIVSATPLCVASRHEGELRAMDFGFDCSSARGQCGEVFRIVHLTRV